VGKVVVFHSAALAEVGKFCSLEISILCFVLLLFADQNFSFQLYFQGKWLEYIAHFICITFVEKLG
jgi:hypothetical protein